jgi:hypothetical protein
LLWIEKVDIAALLAQVCTDENQKIMQFTTKIFQTQIMRRIPYLVVGLFC